MKTSFLNRDELKVVVEVFEPGRKDLVFLAHGLGGYKEQLSILASRDIFLENKYTVVTFDATHSVGESDGLYEDATMGGYYNDLEDVISWAQSQAWYLEPFVLCGSSLGGYGVLAYGEKYPEKLKAIMPLAPVISGKLSNEAYQKYFLESYNKWRETGWDIRESVSRPGLIKKLKWSHMEERLKYDLYPEVAKLTMPVFFVGAENDTFCPVDQIQDFYNKIPSSTKDFKIIPNAPHTWLKEEELMILKKYLNEFIKRS